MCGELGADQSDTTRYEYVCAMARISSAMKMTLILLALAVFAGEVTARSVSLRMPEQRFASLEGLEDAMKAEGEAAYCARLPRHLSFAEFDRPLSAYGDASSLLHPRIPRDADCTGDAGELEAEFVESAPVLDTNEYVSEYAVPAAAAPKEVVFVEAPEELSDAEVSEIDDRLADDQEATLSDEGLHPVEVALTEGEVACDLGRPARQTSLDSENTEGEAAKTAETEEAEVEKSEA